MLSFTHEQNIICSQTQLDDIAHEQAIIYRQLFAAHAVDSQPMKKKKFPSNNDTYFIISALLAGISMKKRQMIIVLKNEMRHTY